MSTIHELKNEIEGLSKEEFAELYRWLSDRDWASWDHEIAADAKACRLDFLVHEALNAKANGKLKDL